MVHETPSNIAVDSVAIAAQRELIFGSVSDRALFTGTIQNTGTGSATVQIIDAKKRRSGNITFPSGGRIEFKNWAIAGLFNNNATDSMTFSVFGFVVPFDNLEQYVLGLINASAYAVGVFSSTAAGVTDVSDRAGRSLGNLNQVGGTTQTAVDLGVRLFPVSKALATDTAETADTDVFAADITPIYAASRLVITVAYSVATTLKVNGISTTALAYKDATNLVADALASFEIQVRSTQTTINFQFGATGTCRYFSVDEYPLAT